MENAISEDGKWDIINSEYLFRRPWLTVRHDQVRLPDGRINPEFYVLEYPDWVNVIAITEDGMFVLERQYRHGLGKTCYEIPAGVIEKGETPLEAAKRELQHYQQSDALLPGERSKENIRAASRCDRGHFRLPHG